MDETKIKITGLIRYLKLNSEHRKCEVCGEVAKELEKLMQPTLLAWTETLETNASAPAQGEQGVL